MSELLFKTEHLIVKNHKLVIRSLLDVNQFQDLNAEAEKLGISSTQWPFFGLIWPSSLIMADIMATKNLDELKILEVGCGVGVAGIIATKLNANITMSDYHPRAEEFLNFNLDLNNLPHTKFERIDWSRDNINLGKFDLIIGSDILYDREHPEKLAKFFNNHLDKNGIVILIDPARGEFQHFLKAIVLHGFVYNVEPHYADTPRKNHARFNIVTFSKNNSE